MESGGTMQQEGTNGFHVGAPPNVMDAPTGVDLKADSPGKDALSQRMGAENIKSTDAETRHSGIDGHAVAPDDVPVSEWNDAIPQGMDQSFSEDEMSHSRDMITNRCASEEPHEANPDSPARLDPQSMEEKPTSSDASRNTSRALTSHLVYETPGTLEAEGEDEFLAGEGRRIPGLGNPCIPVEIVPPFSASSDTGSGGSVAPGDMVHTDKGGHALGDRPRRSPGTHVPGGMVYGDVGGVSSLALKPEGGPTEEDDDPASGTGNRRQPEADRGGWCLGTGPEKPSGWDPEAHAPEASGEMLDVDGAGGTTSSATTPDTLRDLTNSWAGFSKAEENASGRRTGNAAMGPLCGNGARGDGGDTAVLVSPRGIVTNAGRTPSPPEVRGVSKEATPRFSPQTVRKMGEHSSSQPAGGGVGDLVVERHLVLPAFPPLLIVLLEEGGVAPSLQAVKATLARNMAKATVGQMLSNPRRETVEDLARRGIIVTPESGMARSLQGTAMKLERMMTRDNLKHQLEIRSCAEDIHLGSGEIGLTQTRIRSGGSSSSGSARGSGRIAIAPSLQARSVELDLNMRKAAVNRMLRRRPSLCEMDLRGWFDPNAPVLTPSPTHAYEVAYAMVAANRAQTAPTSEASVSSAEDARSTTTGDHSPRSCPVSPFLDPTEPSYVFSLIHCPGELMGADSGDEAVAVSARETDVSFEEEGVWMSKGSRYTRSLMGACSSADVTVISTTSKSVTNTSTSTTSDGIFDSPVGSDQDASTSLARPLHEDVADAEYPDKGSEGDLCCLERPQPEKSGVHGSASSVPVVFGQSTDGDAEAIGDVAREQVRTDVSSDVGDLYGRELCGELSVGLPPATSRGTGASTHAVGDSRSSAEVVIFGGEDKGVDGTLASGRRAEERGASTKGGESRTCREGSNERTSSAVLGGDDRGFSRATALAGRSSPLPALCPIPTAAFDDTPKLPTEIVCERGKEPREMDLGHGGDAIEEERIGDEEYVPAPEDEGVHSPVDLRCATRGGLDWDGDGDGDGGADGDGDGALSPFVEVEGTRDAFRDSPQDRELVCRRPSQVNGSDGGEGTISWDRNDATPVAGEERSSLEVRDLNGGPCDRSAEGSMEEYLRHAALQNDGEATVPSVRNASETISTGEDSSVGVTDRSKMPSTDGSRSDGGDPSTDDPLDSPGESPALKFVSHRADESPNGLCQGGPGGGSSRRSPDICANHSRDYASSMENARRVDDFHPSPLCSQTQRQDYPSVSPDPYATFGLDISFLTPDAVSPAASNLASAETPPTGSRIMREVAQVGRRAARVVGINGQGQSAAEAEDAREKRRQETLQRVAESETPPVSRRTLSVSGGSGERRHLEAFFTSRGDPTDSGEGTGDICLDQGNFHRRISSAMRQPSPRVGDICLEGEGDAEEQVLLSWSFEGPLAPEQKVDAASPSVGAGAEDYPPASPAISIVPKSGCGEDEVVEEVGMHREATDEAVVEEVGMHWEATDEAVVEEVGMHREATDEAVVEEVGMHWEATDEAVVEEVGMHWEATDEAVVEEVGMHREATDEAVVEEVGMHREATDEAVVEEVGMHREATDEAVVEEVGMHWEATDKAVVEEVGMHREATDEAVVEEVGMHREATDEAVVEEVGMHREATDEAVVEEVGMHWEATDKAVVEEVGMHREATDEAVVEEVGMHREATDEAVVEEVGMHWEATDEAVVEEVGTHWEVTDEAVVEEATGSAEEAAGPAWRRSKEVFRSPGRPGGGGEDIRDVEPKVEVFGEMDEPRNPRTEEWKLAAGSQAAGGSCDLGDGGVLPVRSGSTPGSPLPSRSDDCTGRSGDGDGHGDGDEETDGDQDEAGVDGLQQVEPLASPPEVAMSLSLSPVLSPIVMRSASKEGGWSHDADRERQRSENGSPVGEPSPSPGARDAAVACGADDGAGAETDAAVDEKGSAIVAGEESGAVYANSGGNHVGRDDGRDDDRDDGRDDESSSYQECAERNPWEADRGKQEESCPSSPRSMEMSPWNTDVSKSAASTALASALIMINSVGSSSHCKAADDDSNRVGDREVQQGCPGESVAGQGTPAVVGARMPADSLGPGDDKASEAIGGVVDDIPGGRDQEPDWRSRERPCESGETPKSPSPSSSSDERKSMVAGGSSGRWSPRESGSGDERSSVERNGGAMRRKDAPDTEAAGLDTDMRMLEGSHRMFTAIVEGCFGGGDGGVEKEGCKAVDEARLCRGGGGGSTAETNGSKGTMRSSFGREDFFMGLQACLYLSTTKALDDLGRARLKGLILSEDDRVLGALAKLRDGGDLEQSWPPQLVAHMPAALVLGLGIPDFLIKEPWCSCRRPSG